MPVDNHSIVHHSHYGKGEVTKVTENKIYVAFGDKQRIFSYPEAFDKGYLSAEVVSDGTREVILDAAENISYEKIYEALNATVGTSYTGWMKATWPSVYTSLPFRIWFPKLAETKNGQLVSAAFDCVNTISDDWNEVIFDDLKDTPEPDESEPYTGVTLIFAKEPKGGPYIFRGVYVDDKEKSGPKHHVSTRVGTRIKLIGQPSENIEILDDFRNK